VYIDFKNKSTIIVQGESKDVLKTINWLFTNRMNVEMPGSNQIVESSIEAGLDPRTCQPDFNNSASFYPTSEAKGSNLTKVSAKSMSCLSVTHDNFAQKNDDHKSLSANRSNALNVSVSNGIRSKSSVNLKNDSDNLQNGLKNHDDININPTSISSVKQNSNLRFIIIDGSNVAIEHGHATSGSRKVFSCTGIKIAVDFFFKRGHSDIKAVVPRFRRGTSDKDCPTDKPEILDELNDKGFLTLVPSKSYDDRFILESALNHNAIIVSNDRYKDLWDEKPEWKEFLKSNQLEFTFMKDYFWVPTDPMGMFSNFSHFCVFFSHFIFRADPGGKS
jgi:hypothetical protein